ncbi:MAG: SIS domain-containing protein [Thermomicrobiales bacterium]
MSVPTTDSHMYQTMHRQPADVQALLDDGWEPASDAAKRLQDRGRVHVIGIGTSYHAALVGAWLLRSAGADARAVHSFEFTHYPDNFPIRDGDAVIIMTHTGVKTFSKVAMQRAHEAGARVLSVGSRQAEHPGSELVLRTTDREKSAAYTSSHVSAMTVLAQVATQLGELNGSNATSGFRSALEEVPSQIQDILDREDAIRPIAEACINRRIYAAGAGPSEFSAIEAVIKVREAAYGWIDALELEQYLHGPMVNFNPGDQAIFINVSGNAEERVSEVAAAADAMGGNIWMVGKGVSSLPDAETFTVPETVEDLSCLLTVVPMQLFAYHMAVAKGINPDTFRRDKEPHKSAFGLLTL